MKLVTSALVLVACVAAPAMVGAQGSNAPRQPICHVTGDGGLQLINVDADAVPAHLAHGDQSAQMLPLQLPSDTTFTASETWGAPYVPPFAFDGNPTTEWNAGNWPAPTQWIEVDFGTPLKFYLLTALVDQIPTGLANHDITFDGSSAFSWTGNFYQGQLLSESFAAVQKVQKVRITTTSSPSWVAWVDILFYDGTASCPAE